MSTSKYLLYPKLEPPTDCGTWEDIQRLALYEPTVRHAVALVERDQLTREQALIFIAFALYETKRQLFQAEVDRRAFSAT